MLVGKQKIAVHIAQGPSHLMAAAFIRSFFIFFLECRIFATTGMTKILHFKLWQAVLQFRYNHRQILRIQISK